MTKKNSEKSSTYKSIEERARYYYKLYKNHTLQEIGDMEGISRERVRQVMAVLGVSAEDGIAYKRRQKRRKEREKEKQKKKDRQCKRSYGCTWEEFSKITGNDEGISRDSRIVQMYHTHKRNAQRRHIKWELSLPEYYEIIAPHLDNFGLRKSGLVLSRQDKRKGFTKNNTKLMTLSENSALTREQDRGKK